MFPEPAPALREADPAPPRDRSPRPQRPLRVAKPVAAPVPFGPVVERAERSKFEATMMRAPELPPLAAKVLVLLLRYYGGREGAFPSYTTIGKDVGCSRRWAIAQVRCLTRLGIVEVQERRGRLGNGGYTNLFVFHWPERSGGYRTGQGGEG
jgi:hypothetical protein